MEELIIHLELIGKLKIGDKLNIQKLSDKYVVYIDHRSYFSSITRWYNENNRNQSIDYFIYLVNSSVKNIDHERVKRSICNAMIGINCLIFTYSSDLLFVTKLQNILQQFELVIKIKVRY